MPSITLRHVVVGAAKADFVKHSIRVSLDLPLNDETLALRSKLAYLAMEKESITVTLESAQLPLFGGDTELQNTVKAEAARVEFVTLSSGSNSVTLDATSRARMDRALEPVSDFTRDVLNDGEENATPRKVHFIDQPEIKRERARKAKTKKRA